MTTILSENSVFKVSSRGHIYLLIQFSLLTKFNFDLLLSRASGLDFISYQDGVKYEKKNTSWMVCNIFQRSNVTILIHLVIILVCVLKIKVRKMHQQWMLKKLHLRRKQEEDRFDEDYK